MKTKGRKKVKIRPKYVVEYWSNKYVNPDGVIVTKDSPEYESGKSIAIVPDLSEPICMVCGKYWSVAEEYSSYERHNNRDNAWKIWEYQQVRECYRIMAIDPNNWYIKNDRDYLDNVLLVCHHCAIHAYLGIKKTDFFKWVYRKRSISEMGLLIQTSNKYKDTCDNEEDFAKKTERLELLWKVISPYWELERIEEVARYIYQGKT